MNRIDLKTFFKDRSSGELEDGELCSLYGDAVSDEFYNKALCVLEKMLKKYATSTLAPNMKRLKERVAGFDAGQEAIDYAENELGLEIKIWDNGEILATATLKDGVHRWSLVFNSKDSFVGYIYTKNLLIVADGLARCR